jgi:dynactin complex subunit
MNEPFDTLTQLLSSVILPNLKSVQTSQAEQIAANDRMEEAIEELRVHLEAQFSHLTAQLTACRAEVAATQALLRSVQEQQGAHRPGRAVLVH